MDKATDGVILSRVIDAESAGQRLDGVLRTLCPDWSRSMVQRLHLEGLVLLNGRPARAAQRIRGGERLEVLPASTPALAPPDLSVLYEDDILLAVDKPSGFPAHPLRAGETGTVLDGMAQLCPAVLLSGEQSSGRLTGADDGAGLEARQRSLEGGLVHRLDNDTSGVLLAAKSEADRQALRTALEDPAACKEYLAIVHGILDRECDISFPVAHAAGDATRSVAVFPGDWAIPAGAARVRGRVRGRPRSAQSHLVPLEYAAGCTLVRVRVHKAVTHQVRVHMAALGHPIAGDPRYLPAGWPARTPRLALHASLITFRHPRSGETLRITAPWAPDLVQAWQGMGGRYSD